MRWNDKKVFNDPIILNQMLRLRFAGWSYKALAVLFSCDYTSIYHQCQKNYIYPFVIIKVNLARKILIQVSPKKPAVSQPQKPDKWYIVDGEKVNKGKTYAEYLRDAGITKPKLDDRWTSKLRNDPELAEIGISRDEETL